MYGIKIKSCWLTLKSMVIRRICVIWTGSGLPMEITGVRERDLGPIPTLSHSSVILVVFTWENISRASLHTC